MEIKFRVQDTKNNWLYFEIIDSKTGLWDIPQDKVVRINTLGQFVGLRDIKGNDIYTGDIFEVALNHQYEVCFLTEGDYKEKIASFGLQHLKQKDLNMPFDDFAVKNGEVIGTIF